MFAYAPFMILGAPYESTMGLVQKIFYFHAPSGMVMFLSAFVVRDRERGLSVHRGAVRPIALAVAGAELTVDVRAHRAGHRAAVGAQGLGRVVAVGRAADVHAGDVADLRRLPAAAPLRRPGIGSAGRRAWRCSAWRTCRSSTGRSTSGARASEDDGDPDAAARHARSVLVLRSWHFSCCTYSCCARAPSWSTGERRSRPCIWQLTMESIMRERVRTTRSWLSIPLAVWLMGSMLAALLWPPAARGGRRRGGRASAEWKANATVAGSFRIGHRGEPVAERHGRRGVEAQHLEGLGRPRLEIGERPIRVLRTKVYLLFWRTRGSGPMIQQIPN